MPALYRECFVELAKIQNINVFDPSMFLDMSSKTSESRTDGVKPEATAAQPKAVAASRSDQHEGE